MPIKNSFSQWMNEVFVFLVEGEIEAPSRNQAIHFLLLSILLLVCVCVFVCKSYVVLRASEPSKFW